MSPEGLSLYRIYTLSLRGGRVLGARKGHFGVEKQEMLAKENVCAIINKFCHEGISS